MPIDILRHYSIFDTDRFNNENLSAKIIGAGATGSKIAPGIGKLGITDITIRDFDKIESHNIANQQFGNCHIGQDKAATCASLIKDWCGIDVKVGGKFEPGEPLSGIVFLLTDTMESRKQIWLKSIKLKQAVKLLIETRMDIEGGRVYCINPCNIRHINEYEATLYSDEVAAVSACGATQSIGATAEMISGLAQWQLIQWWNFINGKPEYKPFNEIIFYLRPYIWLTKMFGESW